MTLAAPPLRMAVIGVGALGRHHARILSQLPGVELVAVADANPDQGRTVAQAVGAPWTDDFRTLLGAIDAATVVVPTSLHAPIAKELLKRSIHVLVEKPLAGSVPDGETLVRLAREHQVTLQVGHIERFNPAFEQVAQWTAPPKYIRTERYSPYPFRSLDIGAVLDLMVHDIDLVLALTAEGPSRVEAFGVSLVGGAEDCAQARLQFPSGCIADLSVNRVSPTVARSLQVWSQRGCAMADLQARTVRCFGAGERLQLGELPYELARRQAEPVEDLKEQMFGKFVAVESRQASGDDMLTMELTHFVDSVRQGTPPRVDGRAGLSALRVAQQILDGIAEHRWDGSAGGRIGPHVLVGKESEADSDVRRRAA